MPGTVALMVWSEQSKSGLDPAIEALIKGGNFGHAAIKIRIPCKEITNEEITRLKKAGINLHITEQKIQNKEPEPFYEIYFSFWPSETTVGNQLVSLSTDRLGEWSGRETAEIEEIFGYQLSNNEKDIMISEQRRSAALLAFSMFVKPTKPVYSGPSRIFHNIASKKDVDEIILKILNHPSMLGHKLDAYFKSKLLVSPPDTLETHVLQNQSILLQTVVAHLNRGEWDSKEPGKKEHRNHIAVLLKIMEDVVIDLNKKSVLSLDEENLLSTIKTDIDNLNGILSVGIPPDYTFTLPTGNQAGLDISAIINAMCEMSEKNYKITGWNCSSTALYTLLNGFTDERIQYIPDNTKKIIQQHKHKLNSTLKTAPIYTPHQVNKIMSAIDTQLNEPAARMLFILQGKPIMQTNPSHSRQLAQQAALPLQHCVTVPAP